MAIPPKLRRQIAERDGNRCAYCQTAEKNCGLKMHVDHIVPEKAGGETSLDNLCLACFSCNNFKSDKQTGIDPASGKIVPLFHPLLQQWHHHFSWDESKTQIIGHTECGRATVNVLQMNNPTMVRARQRWVSAGWHPPDSEEL